MLDMFSLLKQKQRRDWIKAMGSHSMEYSYKNLARLRKIWAILTLSNCSSGFSDSELVCHAPTNKTEFNNNKDGGFLKSVYVS